MTNFTMVENEILDLKLSGQTFRLYCLLKSYCFNNKTTCFPSQKTLSERLNKSVRTVQRALKELVTAGLVKVKRRGSISNIYELNITSVKSTNASKESSSVHHELNSFIGNHTTYSKKEDSNCFGHYTSPKRSNNWNNKKDSFNAFEQRNYNFDALESILLRNSPVPENLSEILEG